MQDISPWLGNLHDIPGLNPLTIRFVTILVSVVCGALVGLERERAEKPAGLRTVIMICVCATIFTQVSMLMATKKVIFILINYYPKDLDALETML